MPKKEKILVAMSGGVDSSVAAALLVKKGYDVTGAFMVNYDEREGDVVCWSRDYQDALRVAAKLGIPLVRLNFTKEYKKLVLSYMYREYAAGRTPNPDVLCNKFIKFGVWLKKAKTLGFNKLATGHYAQLSPKSIKSKVHKVRLLQARDENKDQTYFLHQLTQEQLRHVLFPLGSFTKPQVRALAKKFGLPTAEKEESMGICFVGEVPMKKFLSKKIKPRPGKIILSSGEAVGKHDGLPFYTIGQRIGAGGGTKALYVMAKNKETNELVVGFDNDPLLYKKEIEVGELNWISGAPKFPFKCLARLRHRQPLQGCVVKKINSKIKVFFNKPQRAVTEGQFAVFYLPRRQAGKKGICLGGGVIK